jgi:pyridoxamine 5'-phosphate oxidase
MTPLETIAVWIDDGRAQRFPEPDAMTLATATRSGVPSARVVLCRGVDVRGLRFFTNYDSRKGQEIADNPHAAAVFYWPTLGRQARVEGRIERLPDKESDAYFESRPRGHQLSAWASAQSHPIVDRTEVLNRMDAATERYEGVPVPRPGYWGGYLLRPVAIELWMQGESRLHDRIRHELTDDGVWKSQRLSP